MGADIVYTEFVSANGIIRENLKTLELVKFTNDERPIGVQIFGEDANVVGKSAKIIYELLKPDLIDINYGCPVPKVTKRGGGSAALRNLCIMEDITQSVIESVPEIPITVKMRAGWDLNDIVSTEAGIILEKLGVSAITLHARTASQKFTGLSNWDLIKELKDNVSIPVIGNGDVQVVEDYLKMKKYTNCDGVMIGRGALGNPWIFKQIKDKINGNNIDDVGMKEILNISRKHFSLLKEDKNDRICVNLAKKHFSYYFKGFNGAAKWRKEIMKSHVSLDIIEILNEMENEFDT
jgi:tRNA-dihydrouridine synthase B